MHVTVPFLPLIVTSIPVLTDWLTLQTQFFPAWLLTQMCAKSWIQHRKLDGKMKCTVFKEKLSEASHRKPGSLSDVVNTNVFSNSSHLTLRFPKAWMAEVHLDFNPITSVVVLSKPP